ncbi:MAG: hypothetical protein HUJ60_03385 [Bacilli bacterium]|nr:hypothetical protein [Bacilli bacterium]
MRIYDEHNCELFFLSTYARLRLIPEGVIISHMLTSEEIVLRSSRKDIARLWKLLECGATAQKLNDALGAITNGGENLFAVLVGKGMIE